jgi:DNA-binding NarL/FixJ family response regulator
MTSVVLFTDEPALALGFSACLTPSAGLDPVWVCRTPGELLRALSEHKPDVALIDLTPEVTFGLLTQAQRDLPACRIVLWVRAISTELAYQAMEMGVRGILRKTLSPEFLVRCLSKVAQGELWYDQALTASFLFAKTVSLTRREGQLVGLLSQGLKNKEIAAALSISEGTVKVYLSRLFQKVGVKDRFELALHGLRNLQNMNGEQHLADPRLSARPGEEAAKPWLRSLVLECHSERLAEQHAL